MSLSWFISKLNGSWWCSHWQNHPCQREDLTEQIKAPPSSASNVLQRRCYLFASHGTFCPRHPGKPNERGRPEKKRQNTRFLLCFSFNICSFRWNILVDYMMTISYNFLKPSKCKNLGQKGDVPASRRKLYHPSKVSESLHGCPVMFDIGFNNGEIETWPTLFWWDLNLPYFSYLLTGCISMQQIWRTTKRISGSDAALSFWFPAPLLL